MTAPTSTAPRRERPGRALTASAVATMLEEDTSPDWWSLLDVERTSRRAAAYGLRGVTCAPERVAALRTFLTPEQRVTAHLGSTEPLREWGTFQLVLAQAEDALADGADQLRVTLSTDDLAGHDVRTVVSRLEALRDVTRAATAGLRLHVTGTDTEQHVDDLVALADHVGLDSLELGGVRPPLSTVTLLAAALPRSVELKVGAPVADLDRLLLAHAAGADVLAADPAVVMAAARAREERGTLTLPTPED